MILSTLIWSTTVRAGCDLLNGCQDPITAVDSCECGSTAHGADRVLT